MRREQAETEIEFECAVMLLNVNITYLLRLLQDNESNEQILDIGALIQCLSNQQVKKVRGRSGSIIVPQRQQIYRVAGCDGQEAEQLITTIVEERVPKWVQEETPTYFGMATRTVQHYIGWV